MVESSLGFKFPTLRKQKLRTGQIWLDCKRIDDNYGSYWRIHDNLYDLSNFIDHHPGGKDWIKLTKGTDITEAFESHHLRGFAEKLLPKFYIEKVNSSRDSPFTYKEDGFYRTLKREIMQELPKLPQTPKTRSKLILDSLLLSFLVFALLSAYFTSFICGLISGICLSLTAIAAHNFFHQADNFRMYYFDFTFMQHKEWRISHALSHHLFTNTINDLEISTFEPFIFYLPMKNKPFIFRYLPWILSPIYYSGIFVVELGRNLSASIFFGKDFSLSILMPLSLLASMIAISGWIFGPALFFFIYLVASFHFGVVGLNAAHHHPDIFHDGDKPRPREELDWGIHQMDAVMDRKDITGSHFLVMTNFGDHALHHLFPTLDHGILEYLYPTFLKVCEDFGINWRLVTQLDLVKGQFRQISKSDPNENPPTPLRKF